MKHLYISIYFLFSSLVIATPVDDSDGADLVRAVLIFQDTEKSSMTMEERFSALYLIGYLDGAARTLRQSQIITLDKKTVLPLIVKDLVLFIGDSKILQSAPAVEVVNAYLPLKYGRTQVERKRGLAMMMKIIGEEGSVQLTAAKRLAEQGIAPDR